MAEDKPVGMSDQDWTNFQSRYRPQAATPAAAPGAAPAAPGSGTPGIPGVVDPALKNPSPAPTPQLQPSPAPSVGLGNTVDAPSPQRVQAPGLQQAGAPLGNLNSSREGDPLNNPAPSQPQSPAQAQQNMLRTQIMGMLGTNVNSASVQDADLSPQSQAFRAAAERSQAARRSEVVQQASRNGTEGAGGVEGRLDAMSQQTGQAIGQNDANLVGQKLETRRQQLNTALQAAQQMGMADESNNLSRQLANLDASIQTRGQDVNLTQIGAQKDLANLDASTRVYLGDLSARLQSEGYSTQERLARLDSELRRYGIDMQGRLGDIDAGLRNRQIDLGYDTLGVDVAKTRATLNRDAVVNGLTGTGG